MSIRCGGILVPLRHYMQLTSKRNRYLNHSKRWMEKKGKMQDKGFLKRGYT